MRSDLRKVLTFFLAACSVALQPMQEAKAFSQEESSSASDSKSHLITLTSESERFAQKHQLSVVAIEQKAIDTLSILSDIQPSEEQVNHPADYASTTNIQTSSEANVPTNLETDLTIYSSMDKVTVSATESALNSNSVPASVTITPPVHLAQSLTDPQQPQSPSPVEQTPLMDGGEAPPATDAATPPAFGTAGQGYWYVQGAGAISFDPDDDDTAVFGLAGVGYSQFFATGHSINAEVNGIGFIQPGEDALGLNVSLLLRWHFLRQQDWSLFIDGGAGILGTTSEVPSEGSQFNFTPQVGGGATIRLNEDQHLMLGLRWHHISNANLYDSNPGRDSIMGFVGLTLPR